MPDGPPIVVVVEDDAGMSRAIERIVRAGGYTAVMFGSAEEALASESTATADCLILDLGLPGLSGFDLHDRLILRGQTSPVIFITAHDDVANRLEAARLGAKSFMAKPFSGRDLLEALNHAIAPN